MFRFVERVQCPLCGSRSPKMLYRQQFNQPPLSTYLHEYYQRPISSALAGALFELAQCLICSLIYQRWVGDDELLATLYSEWIPQDVESYDSYKSEIAFPRQSRDAHELMTASRFLGVSLSEMATLDYGMGRALWPRIAATLGCSSYGSDLVEDHMAFAQRHGVKTVTDKNLGTPRFNFINVDQVMEHVVDVFGVARLLADSLLPSGILKVSVPKGDGIADRIAQMRERGAVDFRDGLIAVHPLEHVNAFNRRALKALARLLGLQIVRPSLVDEYAFLTQSGAWSLKRPKKTAKEMLRPFFNRYGSTDLHVWMQKAGDS